MPKVVDHEERRALIVECAIRLFAERGYANVGLRELAAELGMTKSALYHYFPDRKALFGAVVACVEARDLGEAEAALAPFAARPARERILAFLAHLERREAWFAEELSILLEARRQGEAPAGGSQAYQEALAGLVGLEPGAARALYLAATGLLLDRALGGAAGKGGAAGGAQLSPDLGAPERASLAEGLSWLVEAACGAAAEAARG